MILLHYHVGEMQNCKHKHHNMEDFDNSILNKMLNLAQCDGNTETNKILAESNETLAIPTFANGRNDIHYCKSQKSYISHRINICSKMFHFERERGTAKNFNNTRFGDSNNQILNHNSSYQNYNRGIFRAITVILLLPDHSEKIGKITIIAEEIIELDVIQLKQAN